MKYYCIVFNRSGNTYSKYFCLNERVFNNPDAIINYALHMEIIKPRDIPNILEVTEVFEKEYLDAHLNMTAEEIERKEKEILVKQKLLDDERRLVEHEKNNIELEKRVTEEVRTKMWREDEGKYFE